MDAAVCRGRKPAAAVKMTFGRWVAVALIGCLTLAVAILPADGSAPVQWWSARRDPTPVDLWEARLFARQNHFRSLLWAYDAARDLSAARQAFGSTPGSVGDPDIRFSSDVPGPMRSAFAHALNDERGQRPEWKGHGKVGVLVEIDTATSVNGRPILHRESRFEVTTSRVVAPTPLTGGRCVVVVKLPSGDPWSRTSEMKPVGPVHPLLDGCGFYDAFGPPGVAIARDLADDQFFYARGYAWMTAPADSAAHPDAYAFRRYLNESRELHCLAGNDQSCVDELRGIPWESPLATVAPPMGISSPRALSRELPYPDPLNRMAVELGPQRFSRVWRSAKPLDAAYQDESGETLGQFVRREDTREDGAYRPGAWISSLGIGLTLAAIVACLALTLRFGARPRVA